MEPSELISAEFFTDSGEGLDAVLGFIGWLEGDSACDELARASRQSLLCTARGAGGCGGQASSRKFRVLCIGESD